VGLVGNHGDVVTREHAACVRGHDGEREVDAFEFEDLRNFGDPELDPSLAEGPGICSAAGPELTENPSLVISLHAELGGELDALVQMRFADVAARACREGRDRPELAAVATVPTAVAVGGGIRFRDPV
jgi:hypothetical protein